MFMDLKSVALTLQNPCPKVNPSVSKISLPLHSPSRLYLISIHPLLRAGSLFRVMWYIIGDISIHPLLRAGSLLRREKTT